MPEKLEKIKEFPYNFAFSQHFGQFKEQNRRFIFPEFPYSLLLPLMAIIQIQTSKIRPVTTAHLAQTMALMSLTSSELQQKIEGVLASNPALELVEERWCPTCRRKLQLRGSCPVCSAPQSTAIDEPIVFVSPLDDLQIPTQRLSSATDNTEQDLSPSIEELPAYILRQIAPELTRIDRPIAAHMLANLNDDGLLTVPLVEIARYHRARLSQVQRILKQIQLADPVGVGSSSPQEALLIQLSVLEQKYASPPPLISLSRQAIENGMDLLSRRKYVALSRLLGVFLSQAREVAHFIAENLNPYPGRAHWGDHHNVPQAPKTYTIPDIIISFLDNDPAKPLVIEIAMPISGTLQVNRLFQQALQAAPRDKMERWKADLEQAQLLVKCIQQRNHTMVRLMQQVAHYQRAFIIHGPLKLRPHTRAEIAKDLDVHESTISRAVSGKTVQLPNRKIIPLAKFFDRSLPTRTLIKQIIQEETTPLTDIQLVKRLQEDGHKVARRTVAKYRAMEGILPAYLRPEKRAAKTL